MDKTETLWMENDEQGAWWDESRALQEEQQVGLFHRGIERSMVCRQDMPAVRQYGTSNEWDGAWSGGVG